MRNHSIKRRHFLQHQVRIHPVLMKYWTRLTPEQRHNITGYYWSVNLSSSMLFALAAMSIISRQEEPVVLELMTVEAPVDIDSFSLSKELDLGALNDEVLKEPIVEVEQISSALTTFDELSIPDISSVVQDTEGDSGEIALDDPGSPMGGLSSVEHGLVADTNRKVSQAGGSLKGPIRISLSFTGDDDLDLHLSYELSDRKKRRREESMIGFMPVSSQRHIYYIAKHSEHATLDVDANASVIMAEPCENIVFHTKPPKTRYTICLDNFAERGMPDETSYVVVVKYGKRTKVFQGKLKPNDRMKEIWSFRY